MQKELASQLMNRALALGTELGQLDSAISQIESEQERREFAKDLGEIFKHLSSGIMLKIVRQFPELEPYKNDPTP